MRGDRPYRKRLSLRIGGGKEIDKQWGSWLRASPRGRLKMIEETKEFFKCSKKLSFDSPVMEGDHTHCIGHKSTSMEGGGPIITGVEPKMQVTHLLVQDRIGYTIFFLTYSYYRTYGE